MKIDSLLVLLLAAIAVEWNVPPGFFEPARAAARGVAVAAAAAYLLAAALEAHRPRAARLGMAGALALLVAVAVVAPAANLARLRAHSAPHAFIHDGALQTEIAAGMLLEGRNPYAADFMGTPLERWIGWGEGNPAIRRYTYLPLTFILQAPAVGAARALGLPWDPRVVSIGGLLAAAAALAALAPPGAPRRAVAAVALLNPLAFAWGGEGDVVGLALLAAALLAGARGRPGLAGAALGAALAWKESTWPMAPLLALPAWAAADAAGRRRLLLGAAALPAATILPFLAWDPSAFWGDVVLYKSGGVPDAYAVGAGGAALGVGTLLVPLGLVDPRGAFPFLLLQAAVALPALFFLGRGVLRDPSPARAAGAAVALFLPFAFLGRYLHPNHLAPLLPLLALAATSEVAETTSPR